MLDASSDLLLLIARSIGEPAEDAVQEAFVRLAVQPALPEDPVAWLARVLRSAHPRRRSNGPATLPF